MGVTGNTENKLFKVRTLNPDNLYQVGYNGVLDVSTTTFGLTKVKYEIDNILYTTTIQPKTALKDLPFINHTLTKRTKMVTGLGNPFNGDVIQKRVVGSKLNYKYSVSVDTKVKELKKTLKEFGSDTVFETKDFSYSSFIETNIYKNDKYIGLTEKPIVESHLFIERDEYSILERHQRLSEITNLAELSNYRGGYYLNINTI